MKRTIRFLFLYALVWGSIKVQAQVSLAVGVSVSNATVETGNPFFYTLDFAVTSSNEPGKDVVLTDTLPPYVEFKDVVNSSLIANSSFDPVSRVVSIYLINPLPAGTTGSLQINCAFAQIATPNNFVANNKVTMSASNTSSGPVTSATASITSQAVGIYHIRKEFESYDAVNKIVVWKTFVWVQMQGSLCSPVGTLGISDVTITDSLPAGAVFVSASNGGKETFPGSGKVVWDYKSTDFDYCNPGNQYFSKISVQYPNTPYGTDVFNSTQLDGTLVGNIPIKAYSDPAQYRLNSPLASGNCYIDMNRYLYANLGSVGDSTSGLYIPFINSGNVTFDSATIEIPIPDQIGAYGLMEGDTSLHPTVYYTTNTAPNTKVEIPLTAVQYMHYPVYFYGWPIPTLPTGTYVNKIFLQYKTVPPSFSSYLTIPNIILKKDRNGNDVVPTRPFYPQTPCDGIGTCITYESHVNYSFNGQTQSSSCIWEGMPKGLAPDILISAKNIMNPKSFVPGDTVQFRLFIRNDGDKIENMLLTDTLVKEFEYIPNSWYARYYPTNKAIVTRPTFIQNGQILQFDFSTDTNQFARSTIEVQYKVRIKASVPTGVYYNKFYGKADNYPRIWTGQAAVVINGVNSVTADKGVRGAVERRFLFYPNNATTINGSEVDYKLRIKNNGNTKLKDVVLVDALPFKGDDRGSEFTPFMTSLPSINKSNVTTYYSVDSVICVNEISPPILPTGCVTPVWTTTPPQDLKDIKAMKFMLNDSLAGGDSLIVVWKMSAPSNLKVNQVTYNNFYYQARKADDNTLLLTTSPNKVGVAISALGQIGEYVWLDKNGNGLRDEDSSAGLSMVFVQLWKPGPDNLANTSDDILYRTTVTLDDFEGKPGYYTLSVNPDTYFIKFLIDTCLYRATTALGYTTPLFTLNPAERRMDLDLGLDTHSVAVSIPQVCLGSNVTLTSLLKASYHSPIYQWQKSSDNGSSWTDLPSLTKDSLVLFNTTLADTGLYRVQVKNGNTATCAITSPGVRFYQSGTFSDPIYRDTTICSGHSVLLNKTTPASNSYYWYNASTGGSPQPNPLLTPVLSTSTSYYLLDSLGTCKSQRVPVFISVVNTSDTPTYPTPDPICEGESITLSKTGLPTMNRYWWHLSAVGGIPIENKMTTPSLTTSTTYYLSDSIGFCPSPRIPVQVVVNPTPADPSYPAVSPLCKGETVTLDKPSVVGAHSYYWFTSAVGGTPTANKLTTPPLNASTTYYLADSANRCASERVPVYITVNPSPIDPVYPTLSAICKGSTTTLNMLGATGNYYWYHSPTGGLPMTNNFTTPYLTQPTHYYLIDSTSQRCKSNRVAVALSVKECPKDSVKGVPEIFFPNGFSPNHDGINDFYTVYHLPEGVQVSVWFFNRWGDLVYKNDDYKNDWEGKCETGKCLGEDLPSSTYFLQAVLSNGKKYTTNVTLIR